MIPPMIHPATLSEVAMNQIEYRFTVRPLTQEEGGG
jgi:hypothetical protein